MVAGGLELGKTYGVMTKGHVWTQAENKLENDHISGPAHIHFEFGEREDRTCGRDLHTHGFWAS